MLEIRLNELPDDARQSVLWKTRTTVWLVERINLADRPTAEEMIAAAFAQAQKEGLQEAVALISDIISQMKSMTYLPGLRLALDSLQRLQKLNAETEDKPDARNR